MLSNWRKTCFVTSF